MGNVEEIDEGLHIAVFQKVGRDGLSVVIFVLFSVADHVGYLLFQFVFVAHFVEVVILPA